MANELYDETTFGGISDEDNPPDDEAFETEDYSEIDAMDFGGSELPDDFGSMLDAAYNNATSIGSEAPSGTTGQSAPVSVATPAPAPVQAASNPVQQVVVLEQSEPEEPQLEVDKSATCAQTLGYVTPDSEDWSAYFLDVLAFHTLGKLKPECINTLTWGDYASTLSDAFPDKLALGSLFATAEIGAQLYQAVTGGKKVNKAVDKAWGIFFQWVISTAAPKGKTLPSMNVSPSEMAAAVYELCFAKRELKDDFKIEFVHSLRTLQEVYKTVYLTPDAQGILLWLGQKASALRLNAANKTVERVYPDGDSVLKQAIGLKMPSVGLAVPKEFFNKLTEQVDEGKFNKPSSFYINNNKGSSVTDLPKAAMKFRNGDASWVESFNAVSKTHCLGIHLACWAGLLGYNDNAWQSSRVVDTVFQTDGYIADLVKDYWLQVQKSATGKSSAEQTTIRRAARKRLLNGILLLDCSIAKIRLLAVGDEGAQSVFLKVYNDILSDESENTRTQLGGAMTAALISPLSTDMSVAIQGANGNSAPYWTTQSLTFAINFDEYRDRLLFGYQAVERRTSVGIKPSIKNIVLGERSDGKDFDFNLTKYDNILVHAGSRSGKGVMTLSILGTAIAEGVPFAYLDGKPDMAALFWGIELQARGGNLDAMAANDEYSILAVDALLSQYVAWSDVQANKMGEMGKFACGWQLSNKEPMRVINAKRRALENSQAWDGFTNEEYQLFCQTWGDFDEHTEVGITGFKSRLMVLSVASKWADLMLYIKRYLSRLQSGYTFGYINVLDEVNNVTVLLTPASSTGKMSNNWLSAAQTFIAGVRKEREDLKGIKKAEAQEEARARLSEKEPLAAILEKVLKFAGISLSDGTLKSAKMAAANAATDGTRGRMLHTLVIGQSISTAGANASANPVRYVAYRTKGDAADGVAGSTDAAYFRHPYYNLLLGTETIAMLGNSCIVARDEVAERRIAGKIAESDNTEGNPRGFFQVDSTYSAAGYTSLYGGPDDTRNNAAKGVIIKSYLTLNENDYLTKGADGASFCGANIQKSVLNSVSGDCTRAEAVLSNPAIGFPGLMTFIGERLGNTELGTMQGLAKACHTGYELAWKMIVDAGFAAHFGYQTVEDWLYDLNPESFRSLGEPFTAADATPAEQTMTFNFGASTPEPAVTPEPAPEQTEYPLSADVADTGMDTAQDQADVWSNSGATGTPAESAPEVADTFSQGTDDFNESAFGAPEAANTSAQAAETPEGGAFNSQQAAPQSGTTGASEQRQSAQARHPQPQPQAQPFNPNQAFAPDPGNSDTSGYTAYATAHTTKLDFTGKVNPFESYKNGTYSAQRVRTSITAVLRDELKKALGGLDGARAFSVQNGVIFLNNFQFAPEFPQEIISSAPTSMQQFLAKGQYAYVLDFWVVREMGSLTSISIDDASLVDDHFWKETATKPYKWRSIHKHWKHLRSFIIAGEDLFAANPDDTTAQDKKAARRETTAALASAGRAVTGGIAAALGIPCSSADEHPTLRSLGKSRVMRSLRKGALFGTACYVGSLLLAMSNPFLLVGGAITALAYVRNKKDEQ